MSATNMKIMIEKTRLTLLLVLALLLAAKAHAAAPGITGPTFNLVATPAFISQPDGATVYSWGYGCNGNPAGYAPAAITSGNLHRVAKPGGNSRRGIARRVAITAVAPRVKGRPVRLADKSGRRHQVERTPGDEPRRGVRL